MKTMLKQKNKILWSALTLLLLSAISCNREEFPTDFNSVQLTEQLQSWSLKKEGLIDKDIIWDDKLIQYNLDSSIITVGYPIKIAHSRTLERVIFQIKNKEITGSIWTYKSESVVFNESHYKLRSHEILKLLTGMVIFRDLENFSNNNNIYYMDGGIKVTDFTSAARQNEWPNWPESCNACHGSIILDDVDINGDPIDPDPDPCIIDPCLCNPCGGAGGNGDTSGSTSSDAWEEDKIDDSRLNLCMIAIMWDITRLSQGVGQIVAKFSGNTPGFNWSMKQATLPANINAQTSTQYDTSTGTVTTSFDANKFASSTDLSVTRTILHEAVHAYVVAATFNTTSPSDRAALLGPNWVNAYINSGHDFIANDYINDIADALQEYGREQGYNETRQFYEDLSWGGLETSASFLNKSNTDKNRIKDVIRIEFNGKDRFGNDKEQQGKNADC